MKTPVKAMLAAVAWMLSAVLHAAPAEDALLAKLRAAYPGTAFTGAAPTDLPGIYAVWMGENVAFVHRDRPRYMIFGRLVDVASMRDMTEGGALEQPHGARIDVARLLLADAFSVQQGKGRRRLFVFTDPLCPYCRELEPQLRKLHDVTIFNFLLPFQGQEVPRRVWCAADRLAAWRQALADALPATIAPDTCDPPLRRNLALARQLGIQGTPTLVFTDGSTAVGVMAAAEIEARLARAAAGSQ